MIKNVVCALGFLGLCSAAASAADPLAVWFDQPAADWNEALPVGNGRLGGMVFGGVAGEHLQLNDNTLYSGEPGDRDLPLNVAEGLGQVRQWLQEGKYAEVHQWVTKHWLGRVQNCYQPLGDLRLDFVPGGEVKAYRRELDLANAVARVTYEQEGVTFTREVFASHPAQAIVIRLHASKAGALNFTARLDSPHPTARTEVIAGKAGLDMHGQVPAFALRRDLATVERNGETWKYPELFDQDGHLKPDVLPPAVSSPKLFDGDGRLKPGAAPVLYGDQDRGRGTRFDARLLVQSTDGQAQSTDGQAATGDGSLAVRGASDAVLILTSGSSFNGFEKSPSREGKDESAEAEAALAKAAQSSFGQLREEHVRDYRALFDRVTLNLGARDAQDARPTPERIKHYAQGGDESLAALYYQFGRYLLIAGSRPGGQPLNLQGMWNPYVIPPWAGAYTLNINLEMNYWPAEVSNLSECHEPLLRMIGELAANGRKVARDMYGLPGWVAHHNTTIWRDAQPVDGDAGPAFWNMAGPWLCQDLWTHYQFTGDTAFLRDQAYPIMKGAAEFMAAWLVEDGHGGLTTPIGGSPENRFVYVDSAGRRESASLVPGPTMDMALIRELFTNCARASELLDVDKGFRDDLRAKCARLRPYAIGSRGQLEEWPVDFAENEPTHRHVSHLYGVFPGDQITTRGTPALAAAAARTLDLRGDVATGWSLAWKINLWARLGDGNRAHKCLALLLSPERSYPNLFDSCPPFQIDGNFGAASGIVESLLQSDPGEIELLPALPDAWPAGSYTGLRARGGYTVACSWADHRLESATIRAATATSCQVRYRDKVVRLAFKPASRRRDPAGWQLESLDRPVPSQPGNACLMAGSRQRWMEPNRRDSTAVLYRDVLAVSRQASTSTLASRRITCICFTCL